MPNQEPYSLYVSDLSVATQGFDVGDQSSLSSTQYSTVLSGGIPSLLSPPLDTPNQAQSAASQYQNDPTLKQAGQITGMSIPGQSLSSFGDSMDSQVTPSGLGLAPFIPLLSPITSRCRRSSQKHRKRASDKGITARRSGQMERDLERRTAGGTKSWAGAEWLSSVRNEYPLLGLHCGICSGRWVVLPPLQLPTTPATPGLLVSPPSLGHRLPPAA
jgi:hypothetical protein